MPSALLAKYSLFSNIDAEFLCHSNKRINVKKKKKTAVFDRFMFIKWLLCYAKYCFSWLFYVGNTISNWLFLIPPFFGAILSWQYKLERRYTFAFISLCGKLCHACFRHVVMVMCQYPFILLWTFSTL